MGSAFKRFCIAVMFPFLVWAIFALLWGITLGLSEAVEGMSLFDTIERRRAALMALFFVSLFAGWRISRSLW